MTWLRSCVFAGVFLLASSAMRPAFGAIVTVEIEGVVDSVRLGGGMALDGSVAVGSAMKGTCTYDTQTPDEKTSEGIGQYALAAISLSIGDYTFGPDPASGNLPYFRIHTIDPVYWIACPTAAFSGTVTLDGEPRNFDDFTWMINEFRFMDLWPKSGHYIPSEDLPTSFPDISVFTKLNLFDVGFRDYEDRVFVISGHLTSLTATVIPEPSVIVLLGLGSLALLKKKPSGKHK